MHLFVAIGMKQDSVFYRVFPSIYPPNDMVVIPPCHFGDFLLANWADTLLLFPEIEQRPSSFESFFHFYPKSVLKVDFPFGVIWIGLAFNRHMSLDWCACGQREVQGLNLSVFP